MKEVHNSTNNASNQYSGNEVNVSQPHSFEDDVKSYQETSHSHSSKPYSNLTMTDKPMPPKSTSTQPQVALMVTNDLVGLICIKDLRFLIGDFLEIDQIVRLICVNKAMHDVWSDWLIAIITRAIQNEQLLQGGHRFSAFLKLFNRAVKNLAFYEQYNKNPNKIINNVIASTIVKSLDLMNEALFRIREIEFHQKNGTLEENHQGGVTSRTIKHDNVTQNPNGQSYQKLITLEDDIMITEGNIAKVTMNKLLFFPFLKSCYCSEYIIANIIDNDYHDEQSMRILTYHFIRKICKNINRREDFPRWDDPYFKDHILPNIEKLLKKPNLPKSLSDKLLSVAYDAYSKTQFISDCGIEVLKDFLWRNGSHQNH